MASLRESCVRICIRVVRADPSSSGEDCSFASVLGTSHSDPHDFIFHLMPTVVWTTVHGMNMIDTTACWELFDDAETHCRGRWS